MEYVQERIATLHDLPRTPQTGDGDSLLAETAVVVPMTDREHASLAAEAVLTELEDLQPTAVFVPVRSPPDRIEAFRGWLESFDLPLTVLWCTAPGVSELLETAGLANGFGKGRDVWLALGPAAAACEYVVVHDADAANYSASHVTRLLTPLALGYDFAKGYYARVEKNRLYGRLFRLLYRPLVFALADEHEAPIFDYLASFRYALAGEFAMTAELATQLRAQRSWGLEVGTLGDAFEYAGFAGTAQVDLGHHEHDHRSVAGETGLEGMSREVAGALFRTIEDHGVSPAYDRLPNRYQEVATQLIAGYEADAAFNGLEFDTAGEIDQVNRYGSVLAPPGPDRRLPPWTASPVTPEDVLTAATPWLS